MSSGPQEQYLVFIDKNDLNMIQKQKNCTVGKTKQLEKNNFSFYRTLQTYKITRLKMKDSTRNKTDHEINITIIVSLQNC